MFIKVTVKTSKENSMLVNLENVTMVTPGVGGATIHFTDGSKINVTESFETVRRWVNRKEHGKV